MHFLEGFNDLPAAADASVVRIDVEISGDIICCCGNVPIVIFAEQEKFALRANIHGIAETSGLGEDPLQVHPWTALEGRPVGFVDITNYPGSIDAIFVSPGQDDEGVKIRLKIHVRFIDADKTVNR